MDAITTTVKECTVEFRAIVNDDHYFAKYHRNNLTLVCENRDRKVTEEFGEIHHRCQAKNLFCQFINSN